MDSLLWGVCGGLCGCPLAIVGVAGGEERGQRQCLVVVWDVHSPHTSPPRWPDIKMREGSPCPEPAAPCMPWHSALLCRLGDV
jgi:hypothetical protein